MYVTSPHVNVIGATPQKVCISVPKQKTTEFGAGRHLFLEGDEADYLYEVVTGVLRLTRLMEDGRRQVVAFGYPGDIIGFPAKNLHHSDCDALVPTRVIAYRRAHLESAKTNPDLHYRLLHAALDEISGMQDHFMMLGRKSAGEKVASFLATLGERVGIAEGAAIRFDLPMGRSDIADFLGLTTETVCRSITQLRKSQIIAIDQIHSVVIKKPAALRALGDGAE